MEYLEAAVSAPTRTARVSGVGGEVQRVIADSILREEGCLVMAPYRECAAYLRSTAQKMRHADNKKIFLATADRYDQLAGSLELKSRTPTAAQPEQA